MKTINLLIVAIFLAYSKINGHVHHQRSLVSHLSHNIVDEELETDHHPRGTRIPKVKHQDICKNTETCVPYVQCPAHFYSKSATKCKAVGGRNGVCCSTGQNHTEPAHETSRGHHAISIDPSTATFIAKHSRSEMVNLRSKEIKLLSSGPSAILYPGSASYGHFRNSKLFNIADLVEVMDVASRALEIAIATRAFKDKQGVTNQQLELGTLQPDLRLTKFGMTCAHDPVCPYFPARYRSIDGSCNNALIPSWGMPTTPYARLLPPSYQDGVWLPRFSEIEGQLLPSPRLISANIFLDNDVPNYDYTLLLMQFGQFLSHDITQSIDTSFSNGSAISCCTPDGSAELPDHFRHFACMPIVIPENDLFYNTFNQRCMNFVRSILAPRHDCALGYAQQMNKITHFIDGSSIYGSTAEQTGKLRSFEGGKLNVFSDFGRDLLPLTKDRDDCLTTEQDSACFMSGDTRTNQMISLVLLHTIFLREHNRLAEQLSTLNPHWDDEILFLEARHILIAQLQVIIYKQFLPAVIGDVAMEEFQLNLQRGTEYAYDYDHLIEPSVTNEFASAAFRFGHSMVYGLLKIYGHDKMEEVISIPEIMFNPARLRKREFLDELLSTLTTEPIQDVDSSLTEALTKYLFRGGNPFGIDLASLNIQRGRDHGLRPYNDYRELIGLPRLKNFEEFGPELGEKLRNIYPSINDIDLWVGGLLEDKAPGSIVGYTFRDIIADQFSRLKKGDKYFFENHPSINPGYFTPEQLREVRKASISRIICDNSDGILLARITKNSFRKPGVAGNEFADCASSDIPKINLIYWKD